MARQYVINAFENGPFTGNPAAVVPLESWPEDDVLQAIATQNNLSETAYFVDEGESLALRWFTPTAEIELCGHATLATAHVLLEELGDPRGELRFRTLSGELVVSRDADGYVMDFPAVVPVEAEDPAILQAVLDATGAAAGEVLLAGERAFLVLGSAAEVEALSPDFQAIEKNLPRGDLFVSAPGADGYDIAVRVFGPGVGILEDPATGSAHCAFAPYWSSKLGRASIRSHQLSRRGGFMTCRWREADGRVDIAGSCETFLRGEIEY